MSALAAKRKKDGSVVVDGIPPILAEVLRELPSVLGTDQPEAVRKRLYPDPEDDEEHVAEWRRKQHPELFALLASAREVVSSDLPKLGRGALARTFRIEIPGAHVAAWISALNAARLTLGALNDVDQFDLQPDREPTYDKRGLAILRIDLYGWLQGTLIEAVPHDE